MDRFHLHRPNASGSMDVNQPVSPQRFTDNYGSANANSTGQTGIMEALGSPVVSDNELVLTGRRLPAGSFGLFITSRNQGFAANPGGSSGNLLLGGNVGRYSSTINTVTAAGTASLQLDLTNMPTPSGTTSAMAGQQWNFQFWHRDTNGSGGVTSNFSRGLALTFE